MFNNIVVLSYLAKVLNSLFQIVTKIELSCSYIIQVLYFFPLIPFHFMTLNSLIAPQAYCQRKRG